jgi:TRAP-type mannitol/chloroaromatic compound transport system substrate-binding protein
MKSLTFKACLAALAALLVFSTNSFSKEYNLVSNLTQTSFQGKLTQNLLEDIALATDGKVTFKWHDAGDLVPVKMHLNAVATGSVPAAMTWLGYFSGSLPSGKFFAGHPFAPSEEYWLTWMFDDEGFDILQESVAKLNMIALPVFLFPSETGGFYKKEIKSPEDFKGLRMRIGGWGGEVLANMGAAVTQIPGNELYLAMERGRIDAMEFSSPVVDESWGFDKVANYYYFPGWHMPIALNHLLINKGVWDSLSEKEQKQVKVACRSFLLTCLSSVKAKQSAALERIKAASGIQVKRLPDCVLEAIHESWLEVLERDMEKYPIIKKAYNSFKAHVDSVQSYNKLQELPTFE